VAKKKKYYAVKFGRKPGIYTQWFGENGAESQVKGFPKAVFKGFATKEEAKIFLRDDYKASRKSSRSKKKIPKFKPDKNSIIIYTDGACINNPGSGGYGVVIIHGKYRKELSAGYRLTTNNRMEMMACIVGLKELETPSPVTLYSDSQYVVNGISKGWAKKWQAKDWMRTKKERAKNADLWKQLLELCEKHDVEFIWIEGHAGIKENEICDQLATKAASQKKLLIDRVYENTVPH
jgi:ribonuclease HI